MQTLSTRLCLAAFVATFLAAGGSPAGAAQAFWSDTVGATATADRIEKTSGCGTCADAGGHSATRIDSGNAEVEFMPTWGRYLVAGLGTDTSAGLEADRIDFALTFWPDGGFDVRERGVYRTDGSYVAGDIFTIAIAGSTVRYRKNGTVVHTSAAAPAYPLVFDTTLYDLGSGVGSVRLTGGASPSADVVWVQTINATAAGGTLRKSGGCNGCNDAGAVSAQAIAGAGGSLTCTPSSGQMLYAGLGTDASASTSPSAAFAFTFWPDGGFDIRERGVYRSDGRFVAGDVFTIAVQAGAVKYYRNNALLDASAAPPASTLVADITLASAGAALACTMTGVTAGIPAAPETPAAYTALTDRAPRPVPPLPLLGPAGSGFDDPVFGSPIRRITDTNTRAGSPDLSYRTPSAATQNAWSAGGSYFYVIGTDGAVVPYSFSASTGAASRIQPSPSGNGGRILTFQGEPQFSYVRAGSIVGAYSGPGASGYEIAEYDFAIDTYTTLVSLDTLAPGLAGTYVGGITSSSGPVERIAVFFGGRQQDEHHLVVVFDRDNPADRTIIDTRASTIDGMPAGVRLDFDLHRGYIDRSGRYVLLSPTAPDRDWPRRAEDMYVLDLATNRMLPVPLSALPGGHDALGFGVWVNKDCCTESAWDGAQWQHRSLAAPLVSRDLIAPVLTPTEVYLDDHISWHNARPGTPAPFITALYRYGDNTAPWRAWDHEIVAVDTNVAPGSGATVWRFAHYRSTVEHDQDPLQTSFWYQPRPNVSHDGGWALFTSNWEKTLGIDPQGDPGGQYRQDVFLVRLR